MNVGLVNLHDWIDELCDVLDIETEVDEALVLDLARDAAHNVERRAAPISTYLLGYAAGARGANPVKVEKAHQVWAKHFSSEMRLTAPSKRSRHRACC